MITFLETLFTTGEMTLAAGPADIDLQQAENLLGECESVWRRQMPLEPPAFHVVSALKAARVLEITCRAVVHRQISLEQTEHFLRECGLHVIDDASQHYSVDMVLRFLPQVVERAARISDSDPLLEVLNRIGRDWPLSSVGMKDCAPDALPRALHHESLWRLYLDRIISRKDKSRLNITSVSDAVAAAIGPFTHLAPELAT